MEAGTGRSSAGYSSRLPQVPQRCMLLLTNKRSARHESRKIILSQVKPFGIEHIRHVTLQSAHVVVVGTASNSMRSLQGVGTHVPKAVHNGLPLEMLLNWNSTSVSQSVNQSVREGSCWGAHNAQAREWPLSGPKSGRGLGVSDWDSDQQQQLLGPQP